MFHLGGCSFECNTYIYQREYLRRKILCKGFRKIKEDVDKPLIAILTLNTIAHTVGAILVGVQAEQLPYKFEILGVNVVGIVSAIMTILILVVSEIIPKTIGATHWKKLAKFTTQVLSALIFFSNGQASCGYYSSLPNSLEREHMDRY